MEFQVLGCISRRRGPVTPISMQILMGNPFLIFILCFEKFLVLKNTKNEKYLAGKIISDLDFAGDPSILSEIRSIL